MRILRSFKLRPNLALDRRRIAVFGTDLTYSGPIAGAVMRRTVALETSIYAQTCISPGLKTMKFKSAALAVFALLAAGNAAADFGLGVKAGTLGIGVEGRWSPPIPWFDVRLGANRYDYEDAGDYSGIDYDATLALDSYYLTGNFKFPLSPLRVTLGAYSNGNEVQMLSQDTGGLDLNIGGSPFPIANVGALQTTTSFGSTAPYAGIGFDFELFGKAGLNLDFGVLWQGEPTVSLAATNWDNLSPAEQALLGPALDAERADLEDEMSDLKAWPVISLGFVYNF